MSNPIAKRLGQRKDNALNLDTRFQIFDLESGKLEQDIHNITALPGRLSLEAIFKGGFEANQHLTLGNILAQQKGSDPTTFTNPSALTAADTSAAADFYARKIGYFCIGNGGLDSELPVAMAKPRNYETRLYNMVPFRCIKTSGPDLTPIERAQYRMRRIETIGGIQYYTYYLKAFTLGNLNLQDSNGNNYTPNFLDSQPVNPSSPNQHPLANTSIYSFYRFDLIIDPTEFKEYYKAMFAGSLSNAMLTEFGIVMSNDTAGTIVGTDSATAYNEVFNVELFSKVVSSPSYMDQEENGKRITYSIYS